MRKLMMLTLIAAFVVVVFSAQAQDQREQLKKQRVEKLIGMLTNDKLNVKLKAIETLGELGDESAVEPLIKQLGEVNPQVLAQVALSLGKLKAKTAYEKLI